MQAQILVCDEKLIREAEKFAGGEIHEIMGIAAAYYADAMLFNESNKRYSKYAEKFIRNEKILRAFVVARRLNTGRTLKSIKEDFTIADKIKTVIRKKYLTKFE